MMKLKFYNTPTGQVEEFASQTPDKALLYTCGPTVYDYAHIGNLASYIYWDTLVRILMANNYDVKRVMNITDVGHLTSDSDEGEDKLEKGAKREGKNAWEIASFYTDAFLSDMKRLNLIKPQYLARATDYIPDQLNLIRKLKEKGVTYQINDGIYYDTSKFPTYADFAHLDLDAQKAGARVEINLEKRNNSDFALWKFTDRKSVV
jgi:cysteinyl-tRNA synthetase